jgi:hypothetical protein
MRARVLTRTTVMVVVAVMAVTVGASPGLAASASGCSGSATSVAKDGDPAVPIDTVTAPGPHGTQSAPFLLDSDGTVLWQGQTDAVIQDGTWEVYVWPFDFGGTIDNADAATVRSGSLDVGSYLPRMTGLFYAKATLTGGDGATCTASAWMKMRGSPTATPLWWVALLLLTFGGIGGLLLLLLSFTHVSSGGHPGLEMQVASAMLEEAETQLGDVGTAAPSGGRGGL